MLQKILQWHSETLSIWTMILIILISLITFRKKRSISTLFILLHVLIHAPFSICYHCNTSVNNLKYDGIMIYISHILVHIGLSIKTIPWQISMITIPLYICLSLEAIYTINKYNTYDEVLNKNINYTWILLLHYIPILLKNIDHHIIITHIIGFIVIFFIFKYSIIKNNIIPNYDINIDNALMHIALIFNNMVIYHFAYI